MLARHRHLNVPKLMHVSHHVWDNYNPCEISVTGGHLALFSVHKLTVLTPMVVRVQTCSMWTVWSLLSEGELTATTETLIPIARQPGEDISNPLK